MTDADDTDGTGGASGRTSDADTAASDHDHADVRYLDAKVSVDDRAFSRRVRDRLLAALPTAPTVFDAACGTGVALDRLREWGVEPAAYHGVDTADDVVAVARDRHSGPEVGFTTGDAIATADRVATVGDPIATPDLVVAGCFLDLVPVGTALDAFTAAVAPGGLVYAPFSFDGTTEFSPAHRADDLVTSVFHAEIDAHAGRDSGAGRAAVDYCRRADGRLLAVDAADWVVRPTADATYPDDERYFLATILGYVADALFVAGGDGDPERWEATPRAAVAVDDTDRTVADLRDWLQTRRRQLAAGELVYLAHQLDVLYQTA